MESKTAVYFALALECGLPILESLHHTSPLYYTLSLIISKAPSNEAWGRFRTALRTYCFTQYRCSIYQSSYCWLQGLFVQFHDNKRVVFIWEKGSRILCFNMDLLEFQNLQEPFSLQFASMEDLMKCLLQLIEAIAIKHNLRR